MGTKATDARARRASAYVAANIHWGEDELATPPRRCRNCGLVVELPTTKYSPCCGDDWLLSVGR